MHLNERFCNTKEQCSMFNKRQNHVNEDKVFRMQTILEETIYADWKNIVQVEVSQLTAILGGSLASCV